MKTTTLLIAALLVCFTSGTVLANSHRADHKKRAKQQVERTRTMTVTTRHYKSTYQQEQPPNRHWAKKQRHERRRDYLAQRESRHHTRWNNRSPRDRYDYNHRNNHRQCNTVQNHYTRRNNRVERIVVPFHPIPRVVLTFPW